MAFRFWRRIKLFPGVTLNLSKSGASLSVGPRGAKLTAGPRGLRATAGIPGTGLFHTQELGRPERGGAARRAGDPPEVEGSVDPGFFQRLLLDEGQEALIDGCREIVLGRTDAALEQLSRSDDPDACFLEAALRIKTGDFDRALTRLDRAARHGASLGQSLARHDIYAQVVLPITEEISASVQPDERGLLLTRVEALQLAGRAEAALPVLEELLVLEPADVVVKLSLAELLMEPGVKSAESARRVLDLSEGVENDSPLCTALMLYRARALNHLELHEAARTTCTAAMRRKKGRDRELLDTIRYERALAYEGMGHTRRCRSDLERIYASNADFMDVAERLGV